jgi:hypothetical protein
MDWTIAKDDADWQRQVLERCGGRCSWPGCNSKWELAGHHVIDRRHKELRLIVENGAGLCGKHHSLLQTLGKHREQISRLLIGSCTYSRLLKAVRLDLNQKDGVMRMPSSRDIESLF